jgi:TolA-binding protein
MHSRQHLLSLSPRLILAVAVFASFAAFAQQEDPEAARERELNEGLRYVKGLQQYLFADIADLVLKELTVKFPEAKAKLAVLELEGELARGKFDEVKARIAREPNQNSPETWAMKLALADSYYAFGKYPEAKGIYEGFFKQYEKDVPEALGAFYNDSAYKYAQMLLNLKERENALKMYKLLLGQKKKLPEHVERQCLAEMAEIALSLADDEKDKAKQGALLKEVDGWANKLLWKQDLWFGKAIVLKAHALMINHKADDAKKLVNDYMPTLTAIHQALVEQEAETGEPLTRVSPMAECRYLLAVMLQAEADRIMAEEGFSVNNAEKREEVLSLFLGSKEAGKRKGDGAYNHFLNVYMQYPESNWAADAGERAEAVRSILVDTFGGKVQSPVTEEQTARVRQIQFRDARALFAQGQIDNARDRLIQVLNSFPDCPEAIPALGDLARCYMQGIQDNPDAELYTDTVIGHLAERFCSGSDKMQPAGDELIRLAENWLEYGRADKRLQVYDLFFRLYPDHASCPVYLASFGEKAYQDKDYSSALNYFQITANNYTNSPRAFDALNRIVTIYEETKDLTNAVVAANTYVKRLETRDRPTQELMTARFRLANAYKDFGVDILRSGTTNAADLARGVKAVSVAASSFDKLAETLKNPPDTAQVNDEEKKRNQALREAALYGKAFCLSQVPGDPERTAKIRAIAIQTYEALVNDFPKSGSAPNALIQIGSLYAMSKQLDKSEAALSRLRRDYPDSEQAKNALPMLARNLMELGMREEAVSRYRDMFSATGAKYTPSDIFHASRALLDAREYDLARQGLDRVLDSAAENPVLLAQARFAECELLVATKEYAAAVEKLNAFIADYPNYTLMLDAKLLFCTAASEAGKVEKDAKKRKELFDNAIEAMKDVRKRRTTPLDKAQADVEIGRIMSRKAKAEAEFGSKERANEFRGQAAISYQGFIDSADMANAQILPLVETAYFESVPLLIESGEWEIVDENADAYLQTFPHGRYRTDFISWKNQAKIELGGGNK